MLSACSSLRKARARPHHLARSRVAHAHSQAEASWQQAIRTTNSSVNALVYTAPPAAEQPNGRLKGLTVAIKDNICTKEMPTTCSSAMLREFTSPYDATVVGLLGSEGATVVGKANCDEFGMGSLNVYSVHGPVVNPWDVEERRSAGGSSGGSAAAVAAGMCDVALGTDTGGSIRLPASYCGVVGLKPSYGMLSRWGVVSFADSLDCVGILGKDISSTQRVYDTLAVYDPRDPTAARPETRQRAHEACEEEMYPWSSHADGDLTGLRIGIPQEYFPSAMTPSVLTPLRRTLRALQKRGAELVPVSLPQTQFALSAYYVLASAEASSNLARYDGVRYGLHVPPPPGSPTHASTLTYAHSRTRGFGPEVRKRILLGTYALTADAFDNYFLQAQRVRKLIREDFTRAFRVPDPLAATSRPAGLALPSGNTAEENASGGGVHVLMHPSAIRTAPPLAEGEAKEGGESLDAYVQDVLTVPASLAGVPALSVPVPPDEGGDGWPVGVSVVGQWGCEEMVLRVGRAIEEVARDVRV
ncbi:amidase signature enzyme [Dentipellis sp. KUC8613]|nr:amidase signature enzyme [Dentipellis sp. KUC8613]